MTVSNNTIAASKTGGLRIRCPIRGEQTFRGIGADGLTPTEEARRIDAIKYLLAHGYPADHILIEPIVRQLGHGGKKSVRADLAVTDIPAAQVKVLPVAERVRHASVMVEVKRDNAKAVMAKETQVEPLLAFGRPNCLAVYWDNIEQRVLWLDDDRDLHEADIAHLPNYGESRVGVKRLTFADLRPPKNLKNLFSSVADDLHAMGIEENRRYLIVQQLLLAKMYDEVQHEARPDEPLDIQDPKALGLDPKVAKAQFDAVVKAALGHYNRYLPQPIPDSIDLRPEVLVEVVSKLAGMRLEGASGTAIQALYMWFGSKLYRNELAEYHTPPPMTDVIVRMLAPQQHESIKDPAVGGADFLMAAERVAPGPRDGIPRLFGADVSPTAVMSAHVNALLHGAAPTTKIEEQDSLANIYGEFSQKEVNGSWKGQYHCVVTNPPFGTRIAIKNAQVLANFDLGYEWEAVDGRLQRTKKLVKSQEAGVLFVEAAVRQAMNDGGRIGIVVPNGYLGNRSPRYHVLREWLLRHAKVAAILSFPRFAFKGSGADVSASVLFLERRLTPLQDARDDTSYELSVELLERLGWQVGVKKEVPAYKRNKTDGSLILDGDGEPQIDADYENVMARVRASKAAQDFPWLAKGVHPAASAGWSMPISEITTDSLLCLDPKRLGWKFTEVRDTVRQKSHFRLGDVVDVLPQMPAKELGELSASATYRYVEIQDVGPGIYSSTELRGWELPSRARHMASQGDLFVGAIWGSVSKWFIAGGDKNLVVTNGFTRLRVKNLGDYVDIIAGLCSEAFAVQMRGFSRGSDGLAEVVDEDLREVVLPRVTDPAVRAELQPHVDALLQGHTSAKSTIDEMMGRGRLPIPQVPPRPSHVNLV